MKKSGILVGSLRKASYSRQWAENIKALLPEDAEGEIIEIGDLPLYNEEYDEDPAATPATYGPFRAKVKEKDAYIFVTPEYNRSVPAALKNALDVGSRPYGDSAWAGNKPALVVSQSVSGISGFGANHHLRQSLVFLDLQPVQQPEVYLANSQDLLDANGQIKNPSTVEFLTTAVNTLMSKIN